MIDIEVSPNTAHVWGIYDQNISINQLLESSYTLCYAAKWYGESKIMFDSIQKSGKKKMLESVHKLLDEADAVVHYNGSRFDIPILQKEFLLSGMNPPAPSQFPPLFPAPPPPPPIIIYSTTAIGEFNN